VVLIDGTNRLEITVLDRGLAHLPSAGDVRFSVEVDASGFVGRGTAWVEAEQLRTLVVALRELEATRRGSAEVESMSPGEFQLRVFATDGWGHMALDGRVSASGQSLEFRFAFCPSLLPGLVEEFVTMTSE
jgi:hypothetical protein